jgi:MscS family membrane protein
MRAMQKKLLFGYRVFLALLAATLVWSVWSSLAQNPADSASQTNVVTVRNGAAKAVESGAAAEAERKRLETPEWVERLAQDLPFLKWRWWGNELWKYLFSLIYIFLAFYVSKLLDYLTRVWLKRWAERTETQFDDLLLEVLRGPVKVVAFVIFLRIGLEVFEWPAVVESVLAKGFTVVVAVVITYAVMKLVDLLMGYWGQRAAVQEDQALSKQLLPILRKSLKAFVIVVAALTTLNNLGINITAAIASLSIGGLAVGLAAQDTLANLFGAVAVFVDKPFKIGDRIQLDNVDGTVESIGLRSTRVRNLDGHLITVPNKAMGNAIITNITRRPNIKTVMNIGITYDTPVEKVKRALEILHEIYRGHPKTHDVIISFNKFESSSLNLLVVHWWNSTDYREYLGGMQELNLAVKARFDAEGIEFAFPTQTVYVKQD